MYLALRKKKEAKFGQLHERRNLNWILVRILNKTLRQNSYEELLENDGRAKRENHDVM
jgi:hypothetical protein